MGPSMRVGLTGSTGLIGTALATALAKRGDTVVRFVRTTTPGEDVVRWDPSRNDVSESDLRRVATLDAVVHLAGAPIARRWTRAWKEEIRTSRVRATRLLVASLRQVDGVRVLASGSAIGVYGSHVESAVDEGAPIGDDFLARVCAAWEDEARVFASSGASVALLRTGIVMSSAGGALAKQLPLFRLGLGGPLGSGQQWVSPISLHDEVAAIMWTIDHQLHGPVNLVAPNAVSNEDFTRALANQLHRPAFVRVPPIALKLALGEGLATDAVLASQRVTPRTLLDSGFAFQHPDITAILQWCLQRQ